MNMHHCVVILTDGNVKEGVLMATSNDLNGAIAVSEAGRHPEWHQFDNILSITFNPKG